MERWEGKRISERENRILSLLRNTWQRGVLLCGKKESCLQISLLTQRVESGRKQRRGKEDRGGERRVWVGRGAGGSRGLQACNCDRPCVCLPGFHCIRGSAAFPNQFSSVLHFG